MQRFEKIPFWGRTSFRLATLFLLLLTPLLLWNAYRLSQQGKKDVDQTLRELSRIANAVAIEHSGLINSAREVLLALAQAQEVHGSSPEVCSGFLRRVAEQYSRYSVFVKIDQRGFVICSSKHLENPVDFSKEPPIQKVLATGKFVVSDFVIGPISKKPVLTFNQPLFTNGELSGVLGTGLNLDWLENFLAALNPPPAMRLLLFDSQGTVLASYPPGSYALGSSLQDVPLVRETINETTSSGSLITTCPEGLPILASYVQLPETRGDIRVISFMHRQKALAPLIREQRQQWYVSILALALSLLLVFLASQRLLLRWTKALARQAGRIAAGDLSARSEMPHVNTDMGRLAQLMDDMAAELQWRDTAVRESEMRYRTVAENFPDGAVVLFDKQLRYILADGAGLKEVGLSKEALEGKTLFEVFPPDLCAELEPLYRRALSGEAAHREVPYAGRFYDVQALPLAYGDTPSHGLAVSQDITLRREAEKALRKAHDELEKKVLERTAALVRSNTELQHEITVRQKTELSLRSSEERFRSIIEKTPVGVSITDAEGYFEYVNPAYNDIYGYRVQELLGRHFSDVFPKEVREKHRRLYLEYIKTGEELRKEFTVLSKDGNAMTHLVHTIRFLDTGGQAKRIAFVLDITERKLHEERLRQAKELAEAANNAKSEFLANMSHESRTPMNAIIGMAELLRGTALDDEQAEYVKIISDSANTLLQKLNDVLELSRLETTSEPLSLSPMELRPLMTDASKDARKALTAKGVELAIKIHDNVPNVVLGDGLKVKRVLQLLLSNAVKFTTEGSVTVVIECQEACDIPNTVSADKPSPRTLSFAVNDTGMGVPLDQQHRIFEAFTQAEDILTRSHGGLGLGLTICKRLVELMGGQLKMESMPGQGSSFVFTVPVGVFNRENPAQ